MIDWCPFSAKAKDFLKHSDARYNIAYGSVRSSKTVTMTVRWLKYIVQGPPGDLIMLGFSIATLKRNVLNDLFDIVGENNYRWINRQEGELELLGRRIYTLGASNERAESRIRGATFAGAYCDEANLYPESVWMQLQARLSIKGACCFANCNPESPKHWFYTKVIANDEIKDKKVWKFTMDDNLSLSEEYKRSLASAYTGVFKKRFILGEWCVAEGAIYEIYAQAPSTFIWENRPASLGGRTPFKTISIGVDYGASVSRSRFICTGITTDNCVVALDETGMSGIKTPEQIYNHLARFYLECCALYGQVNVIFCDYGALGQIVTLGLRQFFNEHKYKVQISDCLKGKIIDRILLTLRLMGSHRLYLSQKCKSLDEAFMLAVWDEDKVDTRLDNGTSDIDTLDAFEYSFYSYTSILGVGI